MPYITHFGPCKKCGTTNTIFREKWSAQNQKFYRQPNCKQCENAAAKQYQKENLDLFRSINKKAYLKKVGGALSRTMGRSEEEKRVLQREKANRRAAYVKQASFADELTNLVAEEAKRLVLARNKATKVKWSIDHKVPFVHEFVCGLHIWSNIAVIPLTDNLKKGAKYAVHSS